MADSKNGSRKLIWIMVVLVVLSISAAGISAYLAWQARTESAAEDEVAVERRSPIFVEIDPFTINMETSKGASRLLYIGMTFKVGNEETREIINDHMPQVRSRLLMQLSGEQVDELTSTEGKTQLAAKLMAAIQDPPFTESQPELALEEVLFTEFIVQ